MENNLAYIKGIKVLRTVTAGLYCIQDSLGYKCNRIFYYKQGINNPDSIILHRKNKLRQYMLNNWLQPVNLESLAVTMLKSYQIGANIRFSMQEAPAGEKNFKLALISTNFPGNETIRKAFYHLSHTWEKLEIIDFGVLRKQDDNFTIPVLAELVQNKIFPIFFSGDPEDNLALLKAFRVQPKPVNLTLIDECGDNRLLEFLMPGQREIESLSVIGLQAHLSDIESWRALDQAGAELIRLGKARSDMSEIEPALRDADLLHFQVRAVKYADAPGQFSASSSGFDIDEACQICRYAGMSEKLKAFGIFGFNAEERPTAETIAQTIWYLCDGIEARKQDYPVSTDCLTEYIVELKQLDHPLTFWKSQKSGRWWLELPSLEEKKRLIPCTYNDYKIASQEELPDRLVHAMRRFL